MKNPLVRRMSLIVGLMMCSAMAFAQGEYIGTMTYGDYRLENVRAVVRETPSGLELTMYRVKFSRMMPVRIDATLSGISRKGDSVYARRIVPTAGDKSYDKFVVSNLHGRISPSAVRGEATMKGKRFSYVGRKKVK